MKANGGPTRQKTPTWKTTSEPHKARGDVNLLRPTSRRSRLCLLPGDCNTASAVQCTHPLFGLVECQSGFSTDGMPFR